MNLINKLNSFVVRNIMFLIICIFLLGLFSGCFVSYYIYKLRMSEVVQTGGFMYDGKIYDIKERVIKRD